jgi:hypothetical protein
VVQGGGMEMTDYIPILIPKTWVDIINENEIRITNPETGNFIISKNRISNEEFTYHWRIYFKLEDEITFYKKECLEVGTIIKTEEELYKAIETEKEIEND